MLRNICLTNNHPHGVRLLFLCLMFLLFANLSKAVNTYEIVNDTCYVEYNGNGDSLLVIIQSAWFSDGDHHVSYYVSFTNHPVRPEQQVVPLFPQEVGGVARLSQRDSQISHYMKLHEEYLRQQVDSIIGALLPNGAEIKIRESYPYEYRYIHLDVDKEGCIHAANLYIRNPVLVHSYRGSTRMRGHLKSLYREAFTDGATSNDRKWIPNGNQIPLGRFEV